MSSTQSYPDQIPANIQYFRSVINTIWLYPIVDVEKGLAATTAPYTFDGTNIVCPDLNSIYQIYSDIYEQSAIDQPIGNAGYSVGVGSLLQDMGKELQYVLTSGEVVIKMRLMKLLTPQLPETVIDSPGNAPIGTIGFVTVFISAGVDAPAETTDKPYVVRLG